MPVKRRAPKGRNIVVTHELVLAYKRFRELERTGCKCAPMVPNTPAWKECLVCEEKRNQNSIIDDLTGSKPWLPGILDVHGPQRPEHVWPMVDDEYWAATWSLKQELEKVSRE